MDTQMSTPTGVRIEEVRELSRDVVDGVTELSERMSRAKTPPSTDDLQEIVGSPTTRLIVARDDGGDIVGCITVATYRTPSGVRAWIEDVAVRNLDGGRGIGGLLVEEGLRLAAQAGAATSELMVNPQSREARAMFQRMGFGPYDMLTYQVHLHH